MNTVEPIRDIDLINDIADFLKEKNERDYAMFMFGIYSGLRISDILKLKVADVKNKEFIYMHEMKTDKEKQFIIHNELKKIIKEYVEDKKDYEYLFKSRQGKNKHLSRFMAYRILNEAAKEFGLDCIGTHTMRKTFGYHVYMQTHNIAALKEIFNHDSINTTMRYIGIVQETKDNVVKQLDLSRSCKKTKR
jgi:integrase